nr:hypothetical protein [Methanosarcina siciliae]
MVRANLFCMEKGSGVYNIGAEILSASMTLPKKLLK